MIKKKKIKKIKKKKEVKQRKVKVKKPISKNTFKSNDEKIEIKKIKKQPTEQKIYNIGNYVVYPKHGVGKIISVEKAKIGNIEITFYKVFIEKEKLILSIPLNQQSHLRHVSSINQINKAISILKSKPRVKRIKREKKKQEKVVIRKLVGQNTLKTNDVKIQIKKIKKQPTEKKLYNIKDYVVYPKHGVGKIISIDKAKMGDIDITFYKVLIEKEKLTLSIPLNQQSHLRPVSSISQINKAASILKSKPRIKRTMWSRRAQEYDQKINSGKLYELAEVVRDLNKKTDIIAEQSYSERQLFEKAYNRLKSEFEIVIGEKTQQKMDKALKREEDPTQKETLV